MRFAISGQSENRVSLQFVLEARHLPAAHGVLEYDYRAGDWSLSHPEERIQKMAECFLQSYLDRRNPL
ncbi:MAG TPA: hypothetical protein VFB00_00175 [Terriglobales bacterium]|nr:hypothetical protein [Terriglobales bacterium]